MLFIYDLISFHIKKIILQAIPHFVQLKFNNLAQFKSDNI